MIKKGFALFEVAGWIAVVIIALAFTNYWLTEKDPQIKEAKQGSIIEIIEPDYRIAVTVRCGDKLAKNNLGKLRANIKKAIEDFVQK